jgi:hypothetical protein
MKYNTLCIGCGAAKINFCAVQKDVDNMFHLYDTVDNVIGLLHKGLYINLIDIS